MEGYSIMAVVKQKNLWLLYGSDPVYIHIRKQELLRRYFKGAPPDPVTFEGTGSFQAYCDQIEGQSLFSADTAVIIEKPFFLAKSIKDEKGFAHFLEVLKEAPDSVFVIMTMEGKPDKRLKPVKKLLSLMSSLECSFMKPADGADYMEMRLSDKGLRLDREARTYLETVLSLWTDISEPFLQTECDKIVLMTQGKTVTKALLQDALPEYMDKGIFRFIDRLLARDAAAVIADTEQVFKDTASTLKNLGALSALFRKILMWKEMKRAGLSQALMAERLGFRQAWQMRNLERQARQVTEKEAVSFLLALFQYHEGLRQRGGGSRTIEDILLAFCMQKG